MEQDDLEGRLLAHRRMLQLIVGALAETTSGERLRALFRDRSTMQDGQEDPGAVETAGMGVELALAEEFRRTVEGIPENAPPATGAVRLAGPDSMQDPPRDWDKVDKAADKSFPVSDPAARD